MVGARNPAPLPTGYAAQSQSRSDAKNSRSAERGCFSVLPPPNRRRMVGARNPAPPLAGYAAQSRKARCKKQPERRALRPQARFGAQPPQAALGAEIGCSSVLPAAEQAANGWSPQPCPPLAGYAAQCKKDEASLMYKISRTNSSLPQNAARRPIRRWNIPLCTSFVYISHKIHAQSLSYCYVGVDLLRQIAYT